MHPSPVGGLSTRIVVTMAVPAAQSDPDIAERKNRLYAEGIRRHGGEPVLLDATTAAAERDAAFAAMHGLLISGARTWTLSATGSPIGVRRA